ncbi:Uncharacterised protein [Vibrio cholerae]|nr:Uncharacterised protein [Vibrio cholerae]CSI86884.1 Uncharacterised protein [Vibrio cholerae]
MRGDGISTGSIETAAAVSLIVSPLYCDSGR